MKNRVSIYRVIGTVARNLGLENPEKVEHDFIEWAFEAQLKIGGFNTFQHIEQELVVTSRQATLPSNVIKLIDVKANDSKLREINHAFKSESAGGVYYIDGNILHLGDDYDNVNVSFKGIPTDTDGYPMVNESHVDAVASYIMWKYKFVDYVNGKVPRYIIADLEKRWYWLCGQARGRDNMPSPDELRRIGKVWNNLFVAKPRERYNDI